MIWHGMVERPLWYSLEPIDSILTQWGQDKMADMFADDIFKCIFLNKDIWISIKNSLKFVAKVRIYNVPALVEIMYLRRLGPKPLSEPMMVSLLTHLCVFRLQWVNQHYYVIGDLSPLLSDVFNLLNWPLCNAHLLHLPWSLRFLKP